ncbi:hypothetical protein VN24_03635 [Paenibacillus beijingensis]|uniref:Uncharacterized protein n=1 Tax=Paenibacillus beijingensis TaxID=1126833 RepID=A0A0D5NG28_9BACL|nr:hypothetical protein VN24_03635 [Paenibacillus beijingensis]
MQKAFKRTLPLLQIQTRALRLPFSTGRAADAAALPEPGKGKRIRCAKASLAEMGRSPQRVSLIKRIVIASKLYLLQIFYKIWSPNIKDYFDCAYSCGA